MQIKTAAAVGLLSLCCVFFPVAKADETDLKNALFGQWRDPKTGDSYRFNRNQTYEFRAGAQKRKSGNVSHGGMWTIYDPRPELTSDSKPLGLKLSATHRKILRRGTLLNRPANRVFKLPIQRDQLDVPRGVQAYLSSNGRRYYREPNNPQNVHWIDSPAAKNSNRLFIESIGFVRVK